MFFDAKIAVVNERGEVVSADVPATFESCWLCKGSGEVSPVGEKQEKTPCSICRGDGLVLSVAWDWVDREVRRGFEQIWSCSALA